jgi:hypothetical protein
MPFDKSNYVENIRITAIFSFPIAEPAVVACFPHLPTSPRGNYRLSSSGRLSMSFSKLLTRSFFRQWEILIVRTPKSTYHE